MALSLPISEASWFETNISLGGKLYNFTFTFNSRDERWRLSIYQSGTPIIEGVKLVESIWLLQYYDLPRFDHGDIYCLRVKATDEPLGRNNLGYGKPYELLYFSREEIAALESFENA